MKKVFQNSFWLPLGVLVLGIFISFILWSESKENQRNATQTAFNHHAQLIQTQIQKELDLGINNLVVVKSLFDSSIFVSAQAFYTFTEELLKENQSIQALSWAPLVKNKNRLAFENEIRSQGYPAFQITENDDKKQTVAPAQLRDFYFPVTYIEPYETNKKAHGFDLYSEETRKKALELARDIGILVATPQIDLVQGTLGFLGIAPIYQKGALLQTNFQREQSLAGFVTGVYQINTIISQALTRLDLKAEETNRLFIYDISSPDLKPEMLFPTHLDSSKNTEYHEIKKYEGLLHVPGRLWQLVILPTDAMIKTSQEDLPLKIFFISFAFSLILAAIVFLAILTKERSQSVIKLNQKLDNLNKNLEEKIKLRTLELKRSNEDLQQFAHIASHNLQEPLRSITNFTGILEQTLQDKLDEDSQKNINSVINAASRMRQLIKDLLDFSQIGREDLAFQKLNLNDMLREIIAALNDQIQEKKAHLTYSLLPTLELTSPVISQVFQNLISNAIKFCPNDRAPHIDISVKEEQQQWTFKIQDNGVGIKKEHLKKIFEIFQRLHGRDKYPGTGIGLAICKKIIERHGGKIWAESIPEQGSTFFFTLPKLPLQVTTHTGHT
jgi:signal transduction histidine kinase